MPITVRLLLENDKVIRELDVPYAPAAASRDVSAYPFLSGIDRYGDTIFNVLQRRQVLAEVERLLATDLGNEERESLLGVASLCQQGQTPPHQYLWFIGD
jgi:hypothetical protein